MYFSTFFASFSPLPPLHVLTLFLLLPPSPPTPFSTTMPPHPVPLSLPLSPVHFPFKTFSSPPPCSTLHTSEAFQADHLSRMLWGLRASTAASSPSTSSHSPAPSCA